MKKLPKWVWVFAFIVCWPSMVIGDEVFRGKDREEVDLALRLKDEPCSSAAVLAVLHDSLLDDRRFKRSILTWKGQDWESCYAEKDATVYSIDSEGSKFQPVPRSMFKDESI